MEIRPPILDKRDEDDLKHHLTSLIPFYTGNWVPDGDDPGITLFFLFSWIYARVIERYNDLPKVQLAEFLKFLDIDRLPAAPAKGPVVFTINPDCPEEYIPVPEGTLLEAGEDDEGEPIILETVSSLAASPAVLAEVVSSNRDGDVLYDNYPDLEAGLETTVAFNVDYVKDQQTREVWLGDSALFDLKNGCDISVNFELPDGVDTNDFDVTGALFDAEDDPVLIELGEVKKPLNDGTLTLKFGFGSSGDIEIKETEFNGVKSRWLKLVFKSKNSSVLPEIIKGKCSGVSIAFSGEDNALPGATPDMALANAIQIDLEGGDIKPFGSIPIKGNSFYLACDEAFGKVGAAITVDIKGGDGTTTGDGNPLVIWEYFSGNGWSKLTITSDDEKKNRNFIEASPTIVFLAPKDIGKTKVNGHEHFWIRATLADGSYEYIEYETPPKVPPTTDDINEPQYKELSITYSIGNAKPEFAFVRENLSVHEFDSEPLLFNNLPNTKQAVFLGFDRPLADAPVSLFIHLKNRIYPESFNPDIEWSYSAGPGKWISLNVKDGTRGLTRSGYVSFRGPESFEEAALFGRTLYWLRLENSGYFFETLTGDGSAENVPAPVFIGVFLNAVECRGTHSIDKEVLGSSDGTLSQEFQPAYNPVFDSTVYVEEGKYFDTVKADNGEGTAITPEILTDSAGDTAEVWVPWRRQPAFVSAGPEDRVYIADPTTGAIHFGDGTRGKVPPIGQNNIAISYRTGGGGKTNVAQNTELGLMGAVTFLDAINNPIHIAGGVDMEPLMATLERGPKSIRYRDRAITVADFEDLLLERFRGIASIKCFPETESTGNYSAGSVTVVIIPASAEMQPPLPVSLQSEVEDYLRQRAAAIPVFNYSVNVIGPEYVECEVTAVIIPEDGKVTTGLKETVNSTLIGYFHPLIGWKYDKGWPLKRSPTLSEIIGVIEGVAGVSTVKTASFILRKSGTSEEVGRTNSLDESISISIFEIISSGEHIISIY